MKNNKETDYVGGIVAFFTGIIIGVLGSRKKNTGSDELGILDIEPASSQPPQPTEHRIGQTVLLESLKGISVPGDGADLVTVRVLGLERAKLVAMWGTKGRHTEPTVFTRLADLTPEHLHNIKNNSSVVTPDELRLIDSILEDREAEGQENDGL